MEVVINEELKAYIDPLTDDEYQALERSLLAEGCRDALVLWGDMLVDGHNRHGICLKHGLPFRTVQSDRFRSIEDVHLWMIEQHLGRRSLSDFQRGVLALRKREIVAKRSAPPESGPAIAPRPGGEPAQQPLSAAAAPGAESFGTREDLAKAARLSSSQVSLIEKIQKQAAPEVVAAVKAGTISINAAAAVASLPAEEQKTAATGGKDELKLAARRVREAKRRTAPQAASADVAGAAPAASAGAEPEETLQSLRERVAALTAENLELRRQLAQFGQWPPDSGTRA